MNETIYAVLSLGFVLGVRHAMDPDHLVAVSTIVSRDKSILHSSLAGTLWGLGHTASLLICGGLVLALRLSVPPGIFAWAEKAVALMLICLGANVVWQCAKTYRLHVHTHRHNGGLPHAHLHVHDASAIEAHDHPHKFRVPTRSFFIGMIHGLAGTGALVVLVLASVPSILAGLLYILLFGIGSIGGMLLLSSLISIPFVLSARRFRVFNNALQLVAGLTSIALGVLWI